ncbi:hypothetical protein BHE74_00045582 [Ensete ventricosum]|nr:hypothetical protein BHE74_00045582 [Ensete ventricosum]
MDPLYDVVSSIMSNGEAHFDTALQLALAALTACLNDEQKKRDKSTTGASQHPRCGLVTGIEVRKPDPRYSVKLGRKSGVLAERVNSGANPEIWPRGRTRAQIQKFGQEGDLGRKSEDLTERVNSGANPEIWPRGWTRAQIRRFGREVELGRKSGVLAERVNSGANPEIWPRG